MFNQRNGTFRLGMLIAVVAGLWTIVHLIWNVVGVKADDYWGWALLILFILALILAFVQYAQERPALKAVSSTEPFPEPAISKFFFGSEGSSVLWFVVRMYVGAEWLLAGWEKIISPAWGTSGICRWCVSQKFWRESSGPRMVCMVFTAHRASQRRIFLFPGDLGRICGGIRDPFRHTDGYSGRFRGVDEPELPPGWYGQC